MVSKRDDVYARLRNDILQGAIEPGQPISERAVAESLEASRVPVREALIQLERDGLVTFASQRGAFVRSFTPSMVVDLYEFRQALEGFAAGRAALVMQPAALKPHIRAFERALRRAAPDPVATEREGSEFHEAILSGCGNGLVEQAAARIRDQTTLAKRMTYQRSDDEWLRRSAREHLAIAEAVSSRDPVEAANRMVAHISAWSLRFGGDHRTTASQPASQASVAAARLRISDREEST